MKSFAVAAALVGLAAAWPKNATTTTDEIVWTTEVVTSYETYCPGPTTVVVNNQTHTVTTATTLTITNCPCTITKPHTTTSCTTVGPQPTGPAGDECADKCYAQWIKCKTSPNANQSYCAAQIDGCLGWQWAGSANKPTYCVKPSGTAAPTGSASNQPTGPSKPTSTVPVANGAATMVPFGAAALAAIAML